MERPARREFIRAFPWVTARTAALFEGVVGTCTYTGVAKCDGFDDFFAVGRRFDLVELYAGPAETHRGWLVEDEW
jgi:hypothetical protein